MSSTESPTGLCASDRARLIEISRESIDSGLETGGPCEVDLDSCTAALRDERASFVTLEINGNLRGCIGNLSAYRALASDVAENAWAAAFQDPRFGPLLPSEADSLDIAVSVLSPQETLEVAGEEDLLAQLRPGIDGLVVEEGSRRATFLPHVWESLEDPHVFLSQLRYKAGMPLDYWSDGLRFKRYTTETFQS